jgi:hypothetical protein
MISIAGVEEVNYTQSWLCRVLGNLVASPNYNWPSAIAMSPAWPKPMRLTARPSGAPLFRDFFFPFLAIPRILRILKERKLFFEKWPA